MRGERWMLWFGASREGDFAWSGTGDAPGTFQEVPATQEIIKTCLKQIVSIKG